MDVEEQKKRYLQSLHQIEMQFCNDMIIIFMWKNYLPYPLECNPGVLFFVEGFWVGFNSNFELWMTEYWVPGEYRQILNIYKLNTNMQSHDFKGFT